MHLLVLSAFRQTTGTTIGGNLMGLNAPSGAQCFPTRCCLTMSGPRPSSQCTFWCSVLSDKIKATPWIAQGMSQCTFWCSVLSDGRTATEIAEVTGVQSQCTFWCSVLSDRSRPIRKRGQSEVSMHLLVLSAFRPKARHSATNRQSVSMHLLVLSAFRQAQQIWDEIEDSCLNAPSGAQCFPTELTLFYPTDVKGLNAPSGAQCFPTASR